MKRFVVALVLSIVMITPIFAVDGDVSLPSVPKAYQGEYYCAAVSENCGINWKYFNWKKASAFFVLTGDRIMFQDGSQSKFTDIIKRYDTEVNVERVILVRPNDTAYLITKMSDSKVNYYLIQVYSISTDLETIRFILVRK